MTRINCIPPSELNSKMLVAEFHELPRVFTYTRKLIAQGRDPANLDAPSVYTLGKGHVKFFCTRLGWLRERAADLAVEMAARGMRVRLSVLIDLPTGIPETLMGEWEPDEAAQAANRARIAQRLAEIKERKK